MAYYNPIHLENTLVDWNACCISTIEQFCKWQLNASIRGSFDILACSFKAITVICVILILPLYITGLDLEIPMWLCFYWFIYLVCPCVFITLIFYTVLVVNTTSPAALMIDKYALIFSKHQIKDRGCSLYLLRHLSSCSCVNNLTSMSPGSCT